MHHRPHLTRRPGLLLLAATALAGCTGGPAVEAAPQAAAPACVAALAAAPAAVLAQPRTPLDVPGAVGYGDPQVVVRCGLPALAPTSDACVTVDDVDWVLTADADPVVLVSYGRAPALEVSVPASYGRQNASAALVDLAPVARALPATGRSCVG